MATSAAPGMRISTAKSSVYSSCNVSKPGTAIFSSEIKRTSWTRLTCSSHISSTQAFSHSFQFTSVKLQRLVTKALSEGSSSKPVSGLPIDLRELSAGKRAFIAGVADDNGYGWAIAKSLAAAGAEILVGTWVPALNIFENSLRRGKFDESRTLPDGSLMEITKVYPLDAVYDSPEDVPEDVKTNKRYSGSSNWTVKEVVETVKQDFGSIDILVHSLANGPEVSKSLLETSRNGYLAAISASSYSFVSLLKHFIPIMNPGTFLFQVYFFRFCLHWFKVMVKVRFAMITGGAAISLTYIASERIIPGYGGGMSSAKAALESDTKVLAFEAGRKHKIRVNTISAGPLRSRAAKAIGFIDMMIDYSKANAPLQKELSAGKFFSFAMHDMYLVEEVGDTAAFLASPLASAITGAVVYVDNGLNAMGVGVDSPVFAELDIPKDS
ncbi:NAD(P)-binding Rossmann-fold superfamily protein [Actinidia rufa]|uniref:NAD(P)-binding Rossmann-fold superfamily protein n=1 Tax=Actinidia rufa TaxID=165716 RepID=A0A7J0F4V3_9ERIC|nr:NAD(P)-binding Rossmann-fold superfamily protein [Actinidia rufa]